MNLTPRNSSSNSPEDQAAARQEVYQNRTFLDPLTRGAHPPEARAFLGAATFPVQDGDLATIAAPLDFRGVNYYTRNVKRHAPGIGLLEGEQVSPAGEYTTMGREGYPDGRRASLDRVHCDYAFPAYYITENDVARSRTHAASQICTPASPRQPKPSASACRGEATSSGPRRTVSRGHSDTQRFGLVYIDHATHVRSRKDRAHWYQQLLWGPEARGATTGKRVTRPPGRRQDHRSARLRASKSFR